MAEAEVKERVCEICGKRFVGRYAGRAYAGHMWLAHFKRVGVKARIMELEQQVKDCKRRVEDLEKRKAQLETAFRKLVEIGERPSEAECPYCKRPLRVRWNIREDVMEIARGEYAFLLALLDGLGE